MQIKQFNPSPPPASGVFNHSFVTRGKEVIATIINRVWSVVKKVFSIFLPVLRTVFPPLRVKVTVYAPNLGDNDGVEQFLNRNFPHQYKIKYVSTADDIKDDDNRVIAVYTPSSSTPDFATYGTFLEGVINKVKSATPAKKLLVLVNAEKKYSPSLRGVFWDNVRDVMTHKDEYRTPTIKDFIDRDKK